MILADMGSEVIKLERPGAAAFDPIAQDMGGIMHVTGEPDGPPTSVGLSICDLGTGMWAVQGILAALYERWHTGKGHLVECSLLIGEGVRVRNVAPKLGSTTARSSAASGVSEAEMGSCALGGYCNHITHVISPRLSAAVVSEPFSIPCRMSAERRQLVV
jgi:hypothetical protein